MKIIAPILLLLVSCSFLQAQSSDSLKTWFDRSFESAKTSSLYAKEVNWDSLNTALKPQVNKMESKEDLKVVLTSIINALRDHHGRFLMDFLPFAYMDDHSNSRNTDKRPADMTKWKAVNYDNGGHHFEKLKKDIGYIKIVGIGPQTDPVEEGKLIRNGIVQLAQKGVKKWVLDLRYNGGGNMYPMLEGLAPLLGEGVIGGAKMGDGEVVNWHIKNGDFYRGGFRAMQLPPNPEIDSLSKVVVLTSQFTVSSGEVVATCFKGRKNTFFIGEATGGYVTETNWQPIAENLIMSIAVSRYMDRTGKVYFDNIKPNKEVTFEVLDNKNKDSGIQEALLWLSK